MKDLIVKIIFWLIWVGVAWYAAWLFTQGQTVVLDFYEWYNIPILIGAILLGLYLAIWVVMPRVFPTGRWTILFFGVCLVLVAYYIMQDNPSQQIYLRDILRILGAVLMIVWPMKLLIPSGVIKAQEDKSIEIIEA